MAPEHALLAKKHTARETPTEGDPKGIRRGLSNLRPCLSELGF
jgi:hypothetical protein